MPSYVVDQLAHVSRDSSLYPLLAGLDSYQASNGQLYPRSITFSNGETHPLFVGGIVPSSQLAAISAGVAQAIFHEFFGEKILIIQILEGAIPFCRMVLDGLHGLGEISYELASIKVSSYSNGTKAVRHKVSLPLQDQQGARIGDLSSYDGVVIVDDLIDAGNTFVWLLNEYLVSAGGKKLTGYFLLDKQRKRNSETTAILETSNLLCGQKVPDEWIVGFGLDIALPGTDRLPPLHLFRNALPGGIYAFNSAIEQKLIYEYHIHPQRVAQQLKSYIQQE